MSVREGEPMQLAYVDYDAMILAPSQIAASLYEAVAMRPRRQEFDLRSDATPAAISDLGTLLSDHLGQSLNTAIMKRYNNLDGYYSGAYKPHTDPSRFAGNIALVSLSNLAYLFIDTGKRVEPIRCGAGTVIFMNPNSPHWVTPPLEGIIRNVLFFGQDVTKTPTN